MSERRTVKPGELIARVRARQSEELARHLDGLKHDMQWSALQAEHKRLFSAIRLHDDAYTKPSSPFWRFW